MAALPRRAFGLAGRRKLFFRRHRAAWAGRAAKPSRMIGSSLLPWRRPRLSVIVLHGVIAARVGMLNADTARPLIEKAFAATGRHPVILDIESPGGSPVQSDLIANMIRTACRPGRRACPRGDP